MTMSDLIPGNSGFLHTTYNGYACWQHEDLVPKITHGFMGTGIDCRRDSVSAIIDKINLPSLSLLNQVHGIEVLSSDSDSEEGDGFFIKAGDGCFGIKTADCVPLILIAADHTYGSILHCGWRGTVNGIVSRALSLFSDVGIAPSSVQAYIGPAAQSCCYEVGEEVVREFCSAQPQDMAGIIQPVTEKSSRFYASVPLLIFSQLLSCGVFNEKVHAMKNCTICDENFYSHRRQGEASGRQLSFLRL
jgi:YfiH family protein